MNNQIMDKELDLKVHLGGTFVVLFGSKDKIWVGSKYFKQFLDGYHQTLTSL